ncbi:MAG: FeoB-associated Cys-rich membrane protein [Clostridia bacterium]|nr:FeoB-associated Cys-rich membrane protein [Clostridia bacterium]
MSPIDFVVIGIILLIIGSATAYIIKAKKSGKKCIGCPDSATCQSRSVCSGNCSCCRGCSSQKAEDNNP